MHETDLDLLLLAYRHVKPHAVETFEAAAAKLDLNSRVLEPHSIAIDVNRTPHIFDGSSLEIVKPRMVVGLTTARYMPLLRHAYDIWYEEGTVVLNREWQTGFGRDKLATSIALTQAQIPQVRTIGFSLGQYIKPQWESTSVTKPAFGIKGIGVQQVTGHSDVSEPPPNWSPNSPVQGHSLLQPYVKEGSQDYRAYVVGSRCIGLMHRFAQAGEWRANAALGATCVRVDLEHPAASLAVRAVQSVGLDSGGVDILESPDGLVVLEVDGWAGFDTLSETCDVDVAATILNFMARKI